MAMTVHVAEIIFRYLFGRHVIRVELRERHSDHNLWVETITDAMQLEKAKVQSAMKHGTENVTILNS